MADQAEYSPTPLTATPEEEVAVYRAQRAQREAEAPARIAALPEGVIPHPEDVEIPATMQPATGIKGAVVNPFRRRHAAAYREAFAAGRREAAVHDPARLTEKRLGGTMGSATHAARVAGSIDGFNTFPRQ